MQKVRGDGLHAAYYPAPLPCTALTPGTSHIRSIHAEVKGEYRWPRMHKELLARGIRMGKDRVRKPMQQHGIQARTKRKFVVTTDSRPSLAFYNHRRLHSSQCYLSPMQYEPRWYEAQQRKAP
jgi:transposase InsO family protein